MFFRYLIARKSGAGLSAEELEEVSVACGDEEFVKGIRTLDIFEFLEFTANERSNAVAARSRKLSAIKAFFKYTTVIERITPENPAVNIESPKKKKSLPKFLSREEAWICSRVFWRTRGQNSRARLLHGNAVLNCGMRPFRACRDKS